MFYVEKSGLVQFKYVQDIGNANDVNFVLAWLVVIKHFGTNQYEEFLDKYLTWFEEEKKVLIKTY